MSTKLLSVVSLSATIITGAVMMGSATEPAFVTGGIRPTEFTIQPSNQIVEVGADTTFAVTPATGRAYQWLHKGVPLLDQTNSTLSIVAAQPEDAGTYSCWVVADFSVLSKASANLLVFTILDVDPVFVVYAQPIVSGGGSGSCPGPYKGYVYYSLTNIWGWTLATNTTIYTATDTNRTNTKVEYMGEYGDYGCGKTTVTVPYPTYSPEYQFAIYFTNNVPTTNYPITLSGFNP